ncbi:unnamed protein product [Gongylonema pulchrum]|uniref:Uncharacterized protein n=1 Tax=Gongylonema pulchrum TaxID=637853 RepID=A0A183DIW2_9BILA|nr:unnamed protein product [Gongylonema pulchrum]
MERKGLLITYLIIHLSPLKTLPLNCELLSTSRFVLPPDLFGILLFRIPKIIIVANVEKALIKMLQDLYG